MFASTSFWLAQGSSRDLINTDELAKLQVTQTVIQDERRRRTRWFDGRFFAAKDQIREQDYILTRFADLGRAGGTGVISGLLVSHTAQATVRIDMGQGVTPSGEQVLLPTSVTIDLTQIANFQQLVAAFGLSRLPSEPTINRSGLFILGLRPVEYTGNPIASYPTSVNGTRGVQDGDIIEAAAIILVPYPDEGATTEILQRRSRVARRIFVENAALGVPENVLPLAMIAMDRGVIQWLDVFLVRREVGMEHGSILGLGFAPRALREAHVLQYLSQLSEVITERNNSNRGQSFSASDYFEVLPPAGMLPSATIHSADFSQLFFPSQIQCDLSIIPDDELAPLIEESLLLSPVNLTVPGDELESSSILILVPVPRAQIPSFKAKLTTLVNPLRSAAPGMVFQRKPIESLTALTALRLPPPVLNVVSPIDSVWKQALSTNPLLWYVCRRNLQIRKDVIGKRVTADAVTSLFNLTDALAKSTPQLTDRFTALRQNPKATSDGIASMTGLLTGTVFVGSSTNSRMFLRGAIKEFEQLATLDLSGANSIARRFGDPNLGQGLTRVQALVPDLIATPATILTVAESGAMPELDLLGQKLSDADLKTLGTQVVTIAKSGAADAPAQIAKLLRAGPEVANLELTS